MVITKGPKLKHFEVKEKIELSIRLIIKIIFLKLILERETGVKVVAQPISQVALRISKYYIVDNSS